ncbi:complex I subunit 4 family protein [Phosphitispora fastidiosa]|uniref:complex I subunit 4 family protein n=1 Tax=Phosphitispora fastidiosa TaxID=2837202 RepID=UPI001E3488EE|nr:NADH-quinone oxidoreductase subunit M [Phosphitispora fastidiosa]MBU7005440.1 NADH-quinone oxidoreductase subunit M [Phosphitispora fastidiosa]
MGFPVLTAILLSPIIGALISVFIPKEESKIIKAVAGITTFISLVLTIILYIVYYTQYVKTGIGGFAFTEDIPWVADLGVIYSLGVDGFSLPMLLLTNIIGFTSVFSRSWSVEKRAKEFYILLLILITGVMGTFIARDLFIFFLFYEVVVIPIYIMVIIWGSGSKTKDVTKEYAGMKLTIYLLIGSAFLLAAMIWMYKEAAGILGTPTFDIAKLATIDFSTQFQIVVFGMMAFGFTCLLSMFPFHSWSPDGYAGAPTAVSMIHAGVLKKIGGYGLIRIGLFILPVGAKFWAPLIAIFAVANVVYAALICLAQKDMKYVVGYSSVSHMGFVLIGVASMNIIGLNGAVANMFAHGVMSALFFSMVGYIYAATKSRYIPDLGGLAHQMPVAAVGFVVAAMASAGLPGLVSFVPEFTTFVGAFKEPSLQIPAIIALTGVVLGAVYVLRMVANVLFGPRKEEWDHVEDIKGSYWIPVVVLIVFIVAFGVFPSLLMDMVDSGVQPIAAKLVQATTAAAQMGGSI